MAGSRSALLYADGGRAAALGGGSPDDPGVLGGMVAALQSNVVALQNQNAAFNSTFAHAPLVYIDAGVKAFRTPGRNQPGDGGQAMYKRRSGAPPAMPTYSNDGGVTTAPMTWGSTVYFQSADRFRADGIYDFANGGWWELELLYEVDTRIFGAVCTGLDTAGNDDTQASQDALDWLASRPGALLRCGKVKIHGYSTHSATLRVRGSLISIEGDGPRSSMIRYNTDCGNLVVAQNDNVKTTDIVGFSISNITIRQYNANVTNGGALQLNRCVNAWVTNCLLYNHFGGLQIQGGATINVSGCNIRSGVLWNAVKTGSFLANVTAGPTTGADAWTARAIPTEIYITNFNWDSDYFPGGPTIIGEVEYALLYQAGDGLWLSNAHLFGAAKADCWVQQLTPTTQCDGLRCSNVWFDGNSLNGVVITGANANLNTGTPFGDFQFTGCKWLGGTYHNYGIWVKGSDCNVQSIIISGCEFDKCGFSNIRIEGLAQNLVINGCNIVMAGANATDVPPGGGAAGAEAYGVLLLNAPTNISIVGNVIGGNVQGNSRQSVGIFLAGGNPDFVNISGNTLRGMTWSIRDGTTSKDKFIGNNVENPTMWQGIIQSSNILQIKPGGTYFELAASVNNVSDIGTEGVVSAGVPQPGSWYKREFGALHLSTVIWVHSGTRTGGIYMKSGANTTYHVGDMPRFFYNGTYWREL